MDIQEGVLWIYLLVDVHPLTFYMIVTTTSEWVVMWSPLTFYMIVTQIFCDV